MTNRRMFSLDVVDTDDFIDLPVSVYAKLENWLKQQEQSLRWEKGSGGPSKI